MRDVLESHDLRRSDLSDRQVSLLESAGDADAMEKLLESWPELAAKGRMVRSAGPRMENVTESKPPESSEDFRKRLIG